MHRPRFDLEDRLIDFAAEVVTLAQALPDTGIAKHVARQLLRCGTSPFANYAEAQAAESRDDFLHKLQICLKELRETNAWLKFGERMGFGRDQIGPVRQECNELTAILVVSVRTTRRKEKMSNIE